MDQSQPGLPNTPDQSLSVFKLKEKAMGPIGWQQLQAKESKLILQFTSDSF